MPDFGGAAEGRDAAASIEFELHARVRHVVPVNRQAGARQIRRAGEADTLAHRQPAEPCAPVGSVGDTADALGKADRADAQVICGQRVRLLDDPQPEIGRIDRQPLGDLVQLNFLPEAALRRSVSAFGSAGRLVREHAATLKPVRGNLVGHRLERAGVEGARDAVRSIRAPVEQCPHLQPRDGAVVPDPGLEVHQHRMAAAMAIEHFFAVQTDLHRTIEQHRRLADDNLMMERIALAAESTAVGGCDDANVCGRERQGLRQRAVHVMRGLGARPQHELAVGVERGDGRVLLDRQVRIALIEERVFEHVVGARERGVDVAERERHDLVDIPRVTVLVHARVVVRQALQRVGERAQRLILDIDQIEGFERRQFVARDHRRNRVAHEADAVGGERVLVLADRQDAVGDWKIAAGEHQVHARMRHRPRRIDAYHARVRHRRAEQLAVKHARQHDVVGELRLSRHLRPRVDATSWLADDVHERAPAGLAVKAVAVAGRVTGCAIAASTASKIC